MIILNVDCWDYVKYRYLKHFQIYNITFNNRHKVGEFINNDIAYDQITKKIFKYLKNKYGLNDIIICMRRSICTYIYVNYKYVKFKNINKDIIIYKNIKINNRYRLFYGKLVDYRDTDLVERVEYVNDSLFKLLNKI